jgi:hypothetical protein
MAKAKQLKDNNKKAIRKSIYMNNKLSKPQIAKETGLSLMTVNNLVAEMVEKQELVECGLIPSGGGRPSMTYKYNYNYGHIVYVIAYQDSDNNKVLFRVTNLLGEPIDETRCECLEIEINAFEAELDRFFSDYKNILLLVFGLPGEMVDGEITVCDYEKLIGKKFVTYYEEKYHIPILIENDVNAITFGYSFGQSEKLNVAGIFFPRKYQPGAGLVLEGKVFRGHNSFAGEVGYLDQSIDWKQFDYSNKELIFSIIQKILLSYAVVVAPEKYVIFADFLDQSDMDEIMNGLIDNTRGSYRPSFVLSLEFEEDYIRGITNIGIEEVKRRIM